MSDDTDKKVDENKEFMKNEETLIPSNDNLSSNKQLVTKEPTSYPYSFRTSIQRISNIYDQTSIIYSRIGEGEIEDFELYDDKPFNEDENIKDKSRQLVEWYEIK